MEVRLCSNFLTSHKVTEHISKQKAKKIRALQLEETKIAQFQSTESIYEIHTKGSRGLSKAASPLL